jgi:hypothetical protein
MQISFASISKMEISWSIQTTTINLDLVSGRKARKYDARHNSTE